MGSFENQFISYSQTILWNTFFKLYVTFSGTSDNDVWQGTNLSLTGIKIAELSKHPGEKFLLKIEITETILRNVFLT